MTNLSKSQGLKLATRGIWNYITRRPLAVSYEVTLSCNCNCRHCDLGGVIKDEKQMKPEEYGTLTRQLNPVAVQLSGGEPLLRKDIVDIVYAIKQRDGLPYLILVTNGVLLNESNYLALHQAGVNQFSVSLDFPDERHDEFRRHPGLFRRLERTVPQLARFGYRNIILNTAITRANLRDILPLAKLATDWGVDISYSAYTALRTGDKGYCVDTQQELEDLSQAINELLELKKKNSHVVNSRSVLVNTLKFFQQGQMPNCQAGIRFFVVMPDGSFVPCSLHREKYSSRRELIKGFSRTNKCGACYVAIRSYTEAPAWGLLKDLPEYGKRLFARTT
jgi:MoaA/NifB/PqqE/SkfB family radical SAM enzyme